MEVEALEKVNQAIFSQFPYLLGTEPEVSALDEGHFQLLYKGQVETADKHLLPIFLRVLSDKSGDILKISSSR